MTWIRDWKDYKPLLKLTLALLFCVAILALLSISNGIRHSNWWPEQMAFLGSMTAGFSIVLIGTLLYMLQLWLIRKVDGGNNAGNDATTARKVLRVVIALCMSLVAGAYVVGVFVLIRFLDGLRVPEDQVSGFIYPTWFIVVMTTTFVALTIANCWYACHSRELITPGIETVKED